MFLEHITPSVKFSSKPIQWKKKKKNLKSNELDNQMDKQYLYSEVDIEMLCDPVSII